MASATGIRILKTPPPSTMRLPGPDILKAVAIFGVVFIHTYRVFDVSALELVSVSLRFSVPCFIIIWTFLLEKHFQKYGYTLCSLAQRFLHLFKVYVVWSVLHIIMREPQDVHGIVAFLIRHFSGGAWAGQYFFLVLFQLFIFYPFLSYSYEKPQIKWLLLLVSFACTLAVGYFYDYMPHVLTKVKFRPFIYSVPYVFIGFAFARNQAPRFHFRALFCSLFLPFEFLVFKRFEHPYVVMVNYGTMISSIVLFGVVMSRPGFFNANPRISRFATLIAKHTLIIFLMNPILINLFLWPHQQQISALPSPLLRATLAIVAVALVMAASIATENFCDS